MTAAPACSGSAFGLQVSSAFAVPGLRPAVRSGAVGAVVLERDGRPQQEWNGEPAMIKRSPKGRVLAALHVDARRGHRLVAAGYGTFDISSAGDRIVCRPDPDAPEWLWQRFLLGQAMPYAAVLQGVETFHASAVEVDGVVLAIAGASGAGKSSLALNLAVAGARFSADDVVAIAPGGTTVVFPGPAIANVRDPALRRRAETGERPFGAIVGRSQESVRAVILPAGSPAPLGALYFIERGTQHASIQFSPTEDAFRLIGHAFNALVGTPDRLMRQLDTCARVASTATLFDVRAGTGVSAERLSAAIGAHFSER